MNDKTLEKISNLKIKVEEKTRKRDKLNDEIKALMMQIEEIEFSEIKKMMVSENLTLQELSELIHK